MMQHEGNESWWPRVKLEKRRHGNEGSSSLKKRRWVVREKWDNERMGELKKQGQQKREVGLGLGENAIMR